VRELKNVIRRVLLATGRQVRLSDLPQCIREAYAGTSESPSSAIDREDALLVRVVQESRTMAAAAARLGVTRSTLYRRMERFGLKPRRVLDRD
jgi:transcriptional regulator of acetoin/glycerol metabolism